MIKVKVSGGIGNQMFQYAMGRAVSLRLGTKLALDTTFYRHSKNRTFELNKFRIAADRIRGGLLSKAAERLKEKLGLALVVKEKDTGYEPSVFQQKDGSVFDGHWQNEKYFSPIAGKIREEFALKHPMSADSELWLKKISDSESVSLHIRRGDYTQAKHLNMLGLLPLEYYSKAATIVAGRTVSPVFYVFSDDIGWANDNLKLPYSTEFVPVGDPAEHITLMSRSKHNIIANSSFSWWGAWLNSNPEKAVIAPKTWFINPKKDLPDLVLPTWTKI